MTSWEEAGRQLLGSHHALKPQRKSLAFKLLVSNPTICAYRKRLAFSVLTSPCHID